MSSRDQSALIKGITDMYRIRIIFSKAGAFQYTGNLDLLKAFERIFRRAGIPVAYTQGFHPQPKINIASPLPLGWLGEYELLDVWLTQPQMVEHLHLALEAAAPPGIKINEIHEVDLHSPTIQTLVSSLEYSIIVSETISTEGINLNIERILSSTIIPRTRRGKSYDLRPLIIDVELRSSPGDDEQMLRMVLSSAPGATGRPDEVLDELGIDPLSARIIRTHINLLDKTPERPVNGKISP